MRNIFLLVFVVAVLATRAQLGPRQCDSPIFIDTSCYLLITEVKPLGENPFVEVWNCRENAWFADTLMVCGMYSGVFRVFHEVEILPGTYRIFSLPPGLGFQDGVRIRRSCDTVDQIAMSYVVSDTASSIGLCDFGFKQMVPTPGQDNVCGPVGIEEIAWQSRKTLVEVRDLLGRICPVGSGVPPGVYLYYFSTGMDMRIIQKVWVLSLP